MSEFFGRLETELRAAAERPPRRTVPVPAIVVACALALAVAPIVVAMGGRGDRGGDVFVLERPAASEPPPSGGAQAGDRAYVLGGAEGGQTIASGAAPVSGDWQLVLYKQRESRCVALFEAGGEPSGDKPVLCLYDDMPPPEFSVLSMPWPGGGSAREVLSSGAAPEEAVAVEMVSGGEVVKRVETIETPEGDYFVMPIAADTPDGVLRWVDAGGQAGDREIRVNMP